MTVERITLEAVRFDDRGARVMVPVPDGDAWVVLDTEGASYFKDAADVRKFAAEWAADTGIPDDEQDAHDAYLAIADIIEART